MVGQMASDTYVSFDGSFYLPIFYVWRKSEENLSIRSLPSNFVEGLSLVKTWVTFGIIYATDLVSTKCD